MKYQELLDQASGEVDSAPEASDCSRAFSKVRRCCCLTAAALAGILALQLVAWNQQAHCDVSGTEMVWSSLLPNKTTMQYHSPWFAHEVDVYGEAGSREGVWTDTRLFFGLARGFVFTDKANRVVLQASKPLGWYSGLRLSLWSCTGGDTYRITEDTWRPMFSFGKGNYFDIVVAGRVVARSRKYTECASCPSMFQSKQILLEDPQGREIARVVQESQAQAGLASRRYYSTNLQPELLPNEVVSFLGAAFEIEEVISSKREADA